MKTYLKDILRFGLSSATSAGVVVGTSNWVTRGLTFAVVALTLVASFLFDSKDPRNHARAIKLLGLENQLIGFVHIGSKIIPAGSIVQKDLLATETALTNSETATKNDTVKLNIRDLVKTKDEEAVDLNAKPAVNGVPPVGTGTEETPKT